MLVKHDLTSCGTCGRKTQTINHIVETALEKLEENLTGNTLRTGCLLEKITELTLQNTVCVFCFLLLAQLQTIL